MKILIFYQEFTEQTRRCQEKNEKFSKIEKLQKWGKNANLRMKHWFFIIFGGPKFLKKITSMKKWWKIRQKLGSKLKFSKNRKKWPFFRVFTELNRDFTPIFGSDPDFDNFGKICKIWWKFGKFRGNFGGRKLPKINLVLVSRVRKICAPGKFRDFSKNLQNFQKLRKNRVFTLNNIDFTPFFGGSRGRQNLEKFGNFVKFEKNGFFLIKIFKISVFVP